MSMLKPKYQCIFFDCDGTLVDSEILYSEFLAEKIRYFGYEFSALKCRELFKGMNSDSVRAWLIKNLKNFPVDEFELKLYSSAADELPKHLNEIPGAKELLTSLKNYSKCLVTNGHLHIINNSLQITDLKQFFKTDELFTCELVKNSKPSPDLYLLACEKMKTDPRKSIALEDSIVGVTAALAAGLITIGILAHQEDKKLEEEMLALGVQKIIHQLKDFKALLYHA